MKSKELIQERLTLLKSDLKIVQKGKAKAEKNSNHSDWRILERKQAQIESKIGILLWVLNEKL